MREILATALHIFVILMMVIFIVGIILAATGSFDHWTERYRLKRRRRRLLRGRLKENKQGEIKRYDDTPYASSNPDKETITYKSSYGYRRNNAA
ncbi:hypothetical protein [Mucilaginibacter glaciei]|uniref:Uncharacterized protein n=1 Tax=Mucilaginibacter glaciei TaxID=2772109 RepID=A0A926NQG8_9SPHI|nr:hypothetical protein [Mucilaginibacter glaciei]MBD1394096.1 hypothetical protein [Mucilaginibacter glaciei]